MKDPEKGWSNNFFNLIGKVDFPAMKSQAGDAGGNSFRDAKIF